MSNIINIGGTSGGSGSSVVANPQGAATDTLNKLQVDGTIYGVSGGGSSGHNYSTTEQVVGTWIDGSILYEKTVHIQPTGNTSDYVTAEAISGVNAVIEASFTAIRQSDGNTWYYTGNGSTYPESLDYSNYKLGVRVSGGNLQYYIAGYATQITDIYATIRYTKTTT